MTDQIKTHPQKADLKACPIFPVWRSVVVLVALFVTVASVRIDTGNHHFEKGVDMQLPENLGEYIGFDEQISEGEAGLLSIGTEFAKRRYVGPAPVDIDTEIVLSGPIRSSLHRPQVCLVSQGWIINNETSTPIHLKNGHIQYVRLLNITKQENGETFEGYYLYWYIGKDRVTDDVFNRIWTSIWDRFTRGVEHRWAYVIVSGVIPQRDIAESKQLIKDLTDFTASIIPKIQRPES
jgi:hypothetical protein